ncbi:MAG: DNA ligase D [Planctomycetota bacterium]|jgi:bifunctional non-homologous end joining protein LigD
MAAKKRRTNRTKDDLRAYREKRDFERTPEPRGGDAKKGPSGRLFVVQKHAARTLHYDLRLELEGVLKSWAVPRGPSLDPTHKPLAVAVEDHPIEYASFEGIIPAGEYGGGTVMLWDRGEWEPIGDPVRGYEEGDLKFRLSGEKLRGAWVLARMTGPAGEGGRNWLLIKKRDAEARSVESFNVLGEAPFSVASGQTMDEIATDPEAVWTEGRVVPVESGRPRSRSRDRQAAGRVPDPAELPQARKGRLPKTFAPQLAVSATEAPEGDEWLHEVKLDGYRLVCRLEGGVARLLSRNGLDWTGRFPSVALAAGRLPVTDAILDGEVVALNADGIPDFGALQTAFRGQAPSTCTYYVFDVPYAGGYDLRAVPLIDRKRFLEKLVGTVGTSGPVIRVCEHIRGNGPIVFERAGRLGLEGIVAKRVDAPYVSRRSRDWVKVKLRRRREFVVGGFTSPARSRQGFGALLLGHHDEEGRLVYCGRVGSGFSDEALESLAAELRARRSANPPFCNPEADPEAARAHWVDPALVVEVEFAGWTKDALLRHAVFRGVRPDVSPPAVAGAETAPSQDRRVARAQADPGAAQGSVVQAPPSPEDALVCGVRISHPDRTVYPEDRVTKRDVAGYFEAVADWILPHVARRPLSVVRCPLGLAGESFFQRQPGEGFPAAIRGVTVAEGASGDPYLLIDDRRGLLSLVQMGVLEIHTWGCRADDLSKPDQLVFDLDPGPGIEWEHVVASGLVVRDYLADVGLASFVKTSGGRGLHVVVPLTRRTAWPDAKAFARAVATDLARIAPLNFVATVSKALRTHRVFIDYLRNQRGSTAVAPYSTRARPGACVSTPLRWDELSALRPAAAYTAATVPARLARLDEDPWAAYRRTRQSITARMRRAVGAGG